MQLQTFSFDPIMQPYMMFAILCNTHAGATDATSSTSAPSFLHVVMLCSSFSLFMRSNHTAVDFTFYDP